MKGNRINQVEMAPLTGQIRVVQTSDDSSSGNFIHDSLAAQTISHIATGRR
ncbi:MAG: hypothetical protein M2R45_02456 [Verrucomicrobia subdivision 3 bacterium]|nr:hypothetical protein [Limisphaerales bacterium]MCS1413245.1 hypothetical protein [Limisphaerales bacterium]